MSDNKRCIYCNKNENDGIKLSDSDVIPEALTNHRIRFKCVCQPEHNSNFSNAFESYVIDKLAYLRNMLDLFGKPKVKPTYTSNIHFVGNVFKLKKTTSGTKYFDGTSVFQGTCEANEKHVYYGPKTELRKKSSFSEEKFTALDLNDIKISEEIDVDISVFFSMQMLRLAAKVSYEWYCKINAIHAFYCDQFAAVVEFITKGIGNDSIVEIITNFELTSMFEENGYSGAHSLYSYSFDGNTYVLFSFFGLVMYRVKLKDTDACSSNFQDLKGITILFDGTVNTGSHFAFCASDIKAEEVSIAQALIGNDLFSRYSRLLLNPPISQKSIKKYVDKIQTIVNEYSNNERFNMLLGRHDQFYTTAISILYALGIHENEYCYEMDFVDNITKIFDGSTINNKVVDFKRLVVLYRDNEPLFIQNITKGINIFNKAYTQSH